MFQTMLKFSALCRQPLGKFVNPPRLLPIQATFPRTMKNLSTADVTQSKETNLRVQHDPEQQKFYVRLDEDVPVAVAEHEAVLEYTVTSEATVDLWHTGVPPAFRGKGVAKLLAQAAFDHFSGQKTAMRLSCTYLQRHARLFPQPEHQPYILSD